MDTTGERILDPGAARRAARYAGESDRLGAMRHACAGVAGGAAGLFGDFPGGARAEAAIAASAESLLSELAGAGAAVADIRHIATEVAWIAELTGHTAGGGGAGAPR
ncbi:hypothetical protein [Streptomyces mayteni]